MEFEKFCTFKEGYVNPSQKVAKYFDGPIKWLRATDLNNSYVYNTSKTLSTMGFQSAGKSSSLFKPNSLAISKSGTIGRLGIIKDFMCGNRAVINIEVDKTKMNMLYIFYWLMNKHDYIVSLAVGSVQKNLYVSMLKKLDIDNDNLLEQEAVVKILSSLDKKIENNTKINHNLEMMVQAIFKHWFVDFEFPDKNGKPYKSNGGEMTESKLGLIPERWRIEVIDDLSKLIIDHRGQTPRKLGSRWSEKGIIALSAKNIKNNKLVNLEKTHCVDNSLYKLWMKDELQYGDILLTSEAPLGELYFINNDNKYCLSQRLFAIRADRNQIFPEVLYMYMRTPNVRREIKNRATGTTVTGIRQSELRNVQVTVPIKEIQWGFQRLIEPIFHQIDVLEKENKRLRTLRDTLLPKLMSGEIRVPTEQMVK